MSWRRRVAVYGGQGASHHCILATVRQLVRSQFHVTVLTQAAQLLDCRSFAILVFPGGMDLPYLHHLRPSHTAAIRYFVRSGGGFFGICAGAYFASSAIYFESFQGKLITGPRPLKLMPATSNGPFPPSHYQPHSECGANAVTIVDNFKHQLLVYHNGGGQLKFANSSVHVQPVAVYQQPKPAICIAKTVFGRGKVILSHVHLEFDDCALHGLRSTCSLRTQLVKDQQRRWLLWQQLLQILVC